LRRVERETVLAIRQLARIRFSFRPNSSSVLLLKCIERRNGQYIFALLLGGLGYELLNCHGRSVNPFEGCPCRCLMLDSVSGHRNLGSLAAFAARSCGMAIHVTRRFFRLWFVLSMLWIAAVAFQTWRDIPRDDWARPDLSQQSDDVIAVPVGIFHPVAVLVIERGAKLAFIPPIVVLAFGVCVWAFREKVIRGQQADKEPVH
jgi:hypothetical protein